VLLIIIIDDKEAAYGKRGNARIGFAVVAIEINNYRLSSDPNPYAILVFH